MPEHLIKYDFIQHGFFITFPGYGRILVDETCSPTKGLMHFLVLMLIFFGSWKHKTWFIPTGLVIVHIIGVTRIVGLTIVFVNIPHRWDLFHDFIFRPFFCAMLFLIWVVWVEYFFLPKKTTDKRQNP